MSAENSNANITLSLRVSVLLIQSIVVKKHPLLTIYVKRNTSDHVSSEFLFKDLDLDVVTLSNILNGCTMRADRWVE